MKPVRKTPTHFRGFTPHGLGAVWVVLTWFCVSAAPLGPAGAGEPVEPDPQPRIVLPDESAYRPSPQDGGGSVTVEPQSVPVGTPCTLTFTYRVGDRGIAAGGGVLCYVTRYWGWAPPQNAAPSRPGYCTVTCSNSDAVVAVEVDAQQQTLFARVQSGSLRGGDCLVFTYGATGGSRHPAGRGLSDRYAEDEERFFFKVDGDGDGFFVPIARQPVFSVRAHSTARFAVFGPSRTPLGMPAVVRISALDAANNLVTSFRGTVAIRFDDAQLDGPHEATFAAADRGSIGLTLTPRQLGLARVSVHDPTDPKRQGVSNIMVLHDAAGERLSLFWADLQIHGNLSDGTGTPENIYRYAREVARLDAAALTEHDYWGYLPLAKAPAAWSRILKASAAHNDPGLFVAFPAYEWTNWTFGHRHVLFAQEEDATICAWNDARSDHPNELFAALTGVDCIVIPHHPGGGPIPICWKYHDPVLEPVVELASVHGVSERSGQPGGIYRPVPSGMVQAALARGYRLGVLGSGDTHDGHPGLGSPGSPRPGLAGIYARELTRAAIFEALRARRVYATDGGRPLLRFHTADAAMGGVQKIPNAAAERAFTIAVVGDAPVAGVTVVKNNVDAATLPGSGYIFNATWRDPASAHSGDCYYVRVVQEDGGRAWSSPIWIEVGE